ncbi:hypothetical protein AAMO2058_000601900 [Amorphochlora amoebiformis]
MQSRRLPILFGSQTGCSREVAERVARESLQFHFEPEVLSMDRYKISNLPNETLVVFVASTTGQAETPHNMRNFWRFLRRKNLPKDSLKLLKFTVFGLGDSSYPVYNAVARRLHQRLLDLGGISFHPRGLGDDQADLGYDEALDPWLRGLWKSLEKLIPSGRRPLFQYILPPTYSVRVVEEGKGSHKVQGGLCRNLSGEEVRGYGYQKMLLGRVVTNKRLTHRSNTQDVRHVEFDFSHYAKGSRKEEKGEKLIDFNPGDVLDVYPQNHKSECEKALAQLGLHPNDDIEIKLNPKAPKFLTANQPILPERVRALDLLRLYLDIFGTPRRYFFEVLANHATDPLHKAKLEEFTSPEGQLELYRYNNREKRTYLEVLTDFASAKLSLSQLVSLIPRIQPRQFSIASSRLLHPNQAHICMAVVKYKTLFKREKKGLCSTWLASLDPSTGQHFVPVSFSKGSIRMPADQTKPVIMVGPGTGIAPFMSMCQQRRAILNAGTPSESVGKIYVFFGNRYRAKDFLYEKEWKVLQENKEGGSSVTGFFEAFSRDTERKVYVQHKLAEQKEIIFDVLVKQKGYFLLAGNAQKMPTDVRNQVQEIIRAMGNLTEKEAKTFMFRLDSARRYVQETWS